jgi:hypothetical protein
MQASPEELLLLLKKWESDSKRVIGVCIVQPEIGFRSVFKASGLVRLDEAAGTFSIGEENGDFGLCQISHTTVGYSVGSDLDWGAFSDETINPEDVEEFVVLRNPDLSSLALYSLISK